MMRLLTYTVFKVNFLFYVCLFFSKKYLKFSAWSPSTAYPRYIQEKAVTLVPFSRPERGNWDFLGTPWDHGIFALSPTPLPEDAPPPPNQ
jgi:hypothetical protein